jgi:AraC-like DNA-binding protein
MPLTDDGLIRLRGSGHETRTDASYFHDARRRVDVPHFTIQLTIAGSGFYDDARSGARTMLPRGVAFAAIIPGPFRYGFPPGAREAYEQVHVSMDGRTAMQWQRRIAADFGPVLRIASHVVEQQMLELAHASRVLAVDPYLMSARLYGLLMSIVSALRTSAVEQRPRVARALDILRTQATDPRFNVERLADILGVSREHLAREFRAATGESPAEHLSMLRTRLAARLLREGEQKLEAVARASGFSGANYLCRAFKKRAGVTPAEFRRRRWLTV